jgi:cytoskeletal protein CcmA (bactofilin family)
MGQSMGTIGRTVVIQGELRAREDLTIEGQVKGKIELDDNELIVGPNGRIEAEVLAKVVNVMGKVDGNITASDTINIRETAIVDGALVAPRVGITEGASFRGKIDMQPAQPQKVSQKASLTSERKAIPAPQPVGAGR